MVASCPPGRRARRIVVALALVSAMPALAQYPNGAIVQYLPQAGDPAEQLATALRTLAVSPNDLSALVSAGQNALTLGDPNAAVGFFGRADGIAPRDGRVKAGLGGALVALEKPRDALRYFQEASALGLSDADLGEDRGLAYDLIGDTAHAQRDYLAVLAAHPDDDATRRRLALSQGIAGDRKAAIATLDPLIRKRDMAAWRAQTFVLAMTGDTAGANDITRIMLPQQAARLQPFLVRLAMLSPGDKARAVHFGEMPAAGRSYSETQLASVGPVPTYAPAYAPPPQRPVVQPQPVVVKPAASVALPSIVAATPPAVTVAATPAPAPAQVTGTGGSGPRYVTADGTPMRRIVHSREEVFGLGMPAYEYVPLGDIAVSRATAVRQPATQRVTVPAVAPPSPPPTPVAAAQVAVALSPPAVAPPIAANATVPSSPPVTIATPAAATIAMPIGSDAAGGHYDLPHAATVRQAVPRVVQPTARPSADPAATIPAAKTASPEYLADTWSAVPGDRKETAPANPIVAAARAKAAPVTTRHTPARVAPVEIAQADTEASPVPVQSRKHSARVKPDAVPDGGPGAATEETVAKPAVRGRHRQADATATGDDTKTRTRADAKKSHAVEDIKAATDDTDATPRRKGHHATRDTDDGDTRSSKAKPKKDKPETAAPKIYVQVAGGANKSDMDKAWTSVKGKAPDLMKGRTPSTTPLRATNRLLVGPFKDDGEAQAFVNRMAAKGLSGFTFRSGKGQKVDKVDPGK